MKKSNKRICNRLLILILTILMILPTFPFSVMAEAGTVTADDNLQAVDIPEAIQADQENKITVEEEPSDDVSEQKQQLSDESENQKQLDSAKGADDIDSSTRSNSTEKQKESSPVNSSSDTKGNMPAQEFKAELDGLKVSVSAPEGAFAPDTKIKIDPVKIKDIKSAVERTLDGEFRVVKAVDITFYDAEGNSVQPAIPIKVTLKNSDVAEVESPVVVHVDENKHGGLVGEKIKDITVDADAEEVSFDAEHFSVYAVIDGSTDDEGRATLNFYGKDTSEPIATVYVKNSDDAEQLEKIIYDPGAGVLADGELFRGWNISTKNTTDGQEYTVDTQGKTIEDIRDYFEGLSITEGDVYNIYAMIFNAYSIQYKDEDGVTIHSEILTNRTGEAIPYIVNFPYTPKSQDAQFQGWSVSTGSDKIDPAPGDMEDQRYPNETQVQVSGNITFQANPAEGYWLVFNENGASASYTPPQFVEDGDHPTEPTDPTRLGYTFDGWYTGAPATEGGDPTGTKVTDFSSLTLTQRTTLYAKWKVNDSANYTVIIWKENLAGDGYDFGEAIQLSGTPNTTINTVSQQGSGDTAYARVNGVNKQYEGFHLKEFDRNVTIAPDGTSVVNVYYDRTVYTLRFFYARTYRANNRTYVQVNCNNEGFLQGIANNRNLNASLTYRGNNDYQLLSGSNTWKDVNNNSVNGNPLNLVSSNYLAKDEVTTGTLNINNVRTDVVTGSNSSSAQNVNMTYYYLDVAVRYGQDMTDLWPTPNVAFNQQTMTGYNRANSGYSTIRPLLQGSWTLGNNLGGTYSELDMRLFRNNETTANLITYWRYESYYTYQYNVYFSALEDETASTTYKGNPYVLQTDLSYIVANGQGWANSGAPTDSGRGYWDVGSVTFPGTEIVGRVDVNNGTINVYYDRIEKTINYNDGTYVNGDGVEIQNNKDQTLHRVENIPFGTDLSSYNEGGSKYYTPTAPEGYVFDGWYVDSAGQQENTFTTMPQKDITVYAKWVQKQYRVFLHPNVDSSDTSLDWGNQKMSFRVNYDEQIAGGNDITGTRDDYELIGWYTDEQCTEPFNNSVFVLNDTTVTEDYDKTQPTELDKYGNPDPSSPGNKDAAENRFWITKKLDLYAKWRAKTPGAKGINVIYSANDTDIPMDGTNAPSDPVFYLDNTEAVAGAASTPNDSENYQFLHWVVQTWDETKGEYVDTDRIVYPGDTFTVLKSDARRTDNPDTTGENDKYLYKVQLRAAYGPKDEPTPTHITWYDNFTSNPVEGTNYITDPNLQINEAVPIEPADRFTRPGYKFLGWARVPSTDESGNPLPGYKLDPRNLTEDDVYLKYNEETDSFTAVGADGNTHTVIQVAADEKFPYHDMYAVWEPVKYNVVIRKHITGDYSDTSKEFTYTPSATLDSSQTQFTLTDYGKSNIQKKYENVDFNTVISVTEDEQGYTKSVTVKKFSDADMTTQVGDTVTITDGSDITVDNYVLIEYNNTLNIIITGIKEHGGMLALLTVGIAAMVGTFVMQRSRRRRRANE